jgi:hypothetical protein
MSLHGWYLFLAMLMGFPTFAPGQKPPQPVNIMNTPSVSIANGSVPVSGTVSIANTSVPVTGTLTVSNLPLDAEGNIRTSLVQSPSSKYEFKNVSTHFCSVAPSEICVSNPTEQDADPVLTSLASEGWELIAEVYYTKSTWTNSWGNQMFSTGIVYTFRRAQ